MRRRQALDSLIDKVQVRYCFGGMRDRADYRSIEKRWEDGSLARGGAGEVVRWARDGAWVGRTACTRRSWELDLSGLTPSPADVASRD